MHDRLFGIQACTGTPTGSKANGHAVAGCRKTTDSVRIVAAGGETSVVELFLMKLGSGRPQVSARSPEGAVAGIRAASPPTVPKGEVLGEAP